MVRIRKPLATNSTESEWLTMPSNTGEYDDEKETGRLEEFSDGVFSIAITLLVLDIKVPRAPDLIGQSTLSGALLRQWPTYVA